MSPERARTVVAITSLLRGDRFGFVVVSVLVNSLLLVRSYVTMQVLDHRELGLAALLQAIVLLVGITQLGALNGGYRLLCSANSVERNHINNSVYSFIGLIAIIAFLIGFAWVPHLSTVSAAVMLLGIVGGLATLVRTWMSNQMVALAELRQLNVLNVVAAAGSTAALCLIPWNPLAACLIAVVVQPLIFMVHAAVKNRDLLPSGFEVEWGIVARIFGAGFLTYLAALFMQVNLQAERWYVVSFLGVESLGHLYLSILFVTIFQMVPTSLDQVLLPAVVRRREAEGDRGVGLVIRRYSLIMLVYCAAIALGMLIFAQPIISRVLPRYLPDLQYVFILLPGMIVYSMASPLALIFSVLIRFKWYIASFAAGLCLTTGLFLWAAATGSVLSLAQVSGIRAASYVAIGVALVFGVWAITRDLPEVRAGILRRPGVSDD